MTERDMESSNGQMEILTKAIGSKIKNVDLENIIKIMGMSIKESSKRIKSTDKAFLPGKTGTHTRDSGRITKGRDRANP